jgi:hypothetical protein
MKILGRQEIGAAPGRSVADSENRRQKGMGEALLPSKGGEDRLDPIWPDDGGSAVKIADENWGGITNVISSKDE